MADIVVGDVAVQIVPSAKGFDAKVAAEVEPGAKRLGERIAKMLEDKISSSIKRGFAAGLVGSAEQSRVAGGRAGADFGGEFARKAREHIAAALASLPDAKIGVATSAADQKLIDLRARMEALLHKEIGVDLTGREAAVEIEKIRVELLALKKSASVDLKFDIGAATAKLLEFKVAMKALSGESGGGFLSRLGEIASSAGGGLSSMAGAIPPLVAAIAILVPAAIALSAALGGVLVALTVPLGAATLGLGLFAIMAKTAVTYVSSIGNKIEALQLNAGLSTTSAKTRATDLKKAAALRASLTQPQQGFLDAQNNVNDAFRSFQSGKTGDALLGPLSAGLNVVAALMKGLAPIIFSVSKALTGLFDSIIPHLKGPEFTKFVDGLAKMAGSSISTVGHIIGSIASAFAALFGAASGTGVSALNGIADALDRFAKYLHSTTGQEKLQAFFQWLRDKGPGILAFVDSFVMAVLRLGVAMVPVGVTIIGVFTKITDGISKIPIPILTMATAAIIGFGLAIAALGIAASANAFTLIAAGVAAVVVGLIYAYNHVKWFHNAVDTAFHAIATVATWLFHTILIPAVNLFLFALEAVAKGVALILHGMGFFSDGAGKMANKLDGFISNVDQLRNSINGLKDHKTNISVPTSAQLAGVRALGVAINGLTSRQLQIAVSYTAQGSIGSQSLGQMLNLGGVTKRARGGWVTGPGSGTSDSVPLAASNGEFVVNAAAASRNAATLQAMNSGHTNHAQARAAGGGTQRMVITNYDVMTGHLEMVASNVISDQSDFAGTMARMGR